MNFNWKDRVDGQDDVLAEDINTLARAISDLNNSNFVKDPNYVHTDNNFTNVHKIAIEAIANNAYIGNASFSTMNNTSRDYFTVNLLDTNLTTKINVGDFICLSNTKLCVKVIEIYTDSVSYSGFSEFVNLILANKKMRLGIFDVELVSSDIYLTQIDKYVNTIVYLTKNVVNYPTKEEMNTAIVEGDPKYELIQTITVANDGVYVFTFDKDINGDAFKLDAVVLYISCPSAPSTSSYWKVGTAEAALLHYFKPDSASAEILLRTERMGNGVWAGLRSRNSSSSLTNSPIYGSQIGFNVDYVETIYMQLNGIPAGTKINVYGRRVNK